MKSSILAIASSFYGGGLSILAGLDYIWVDPSDKSTLFQDLKATVPVTASGQPVALALDKGSDLALGTQEITNGDGGTFDANITGVTANNTTVERDTTIFPSGGLKVTVTAGTNNMQALIQTKSLTNGKWYKVTCDGYVPSSNTVDSICIGIDGAGSGISANLTATDTVGEMSFIFQATGGNVNFYAFMLQNGVSWSSIGDVGYFDNFSVRELAGRHFIGAATYIESAGLSLLRYNGSTNHMRLSGAPNFNSDIRTFIAGKKSTSTAQGIFYQHGSNETVNGAIGLLANSTADGGVGRYQATFRGTTAAVLGSATTHAINTTHLVNFTGSVSAPSVIFRHNGDVDTTNTDTQGTGNYIETNFMALGARMNQTSGAITVPWAGDMYNVFIVGGSMTDAQRDFIEGYVADKSGVTL